MEYYTSLGARFEVITLVVIGTDCTGSVNPTTKLFWYRVFSSLIMVRQKLTLAERWQGVGMF
jgi:hypothetical protein